MGLQQNWNGQGNITVVATDEYQLSDTTIFGVTVLPVNDSPSNFELLFPTIIDTVQISADTDETIPFEWEESIDIDSEISYSLNIIFSNADILHEVEYNDILNTNYGVSTYEYAMLMSNNSLALAYIYYIVEATDGEFNVVSDSGKFVLNNVSLSTQIDIKPERFSLHQNYPNPFNPSTTIAYDLPIASIVNITIYDMMGRKIKTLVNEHEAAGFKYTQWDGRNDKNESVSAGLYVYLLQTEKFMQNKKMIFLK